MTKLAGALCDMNSAEMMGTPEAIIKPGDLSQSISAFQRSIQLSYGRNPGEVDS